METATKINVNGQYYCQSEAHGGLISLNTDAPAYIFCPFCGGYFVETINTVDREEVL